MRKAAAKTSPAPVGSTAVVGKASIRRQTPRWQSSAPPPARAVAAPRAPLGAGERQRLDAGAPALQDGPDVRLRQVFVGDEEDATGLEQPLRLPALRRHRPDAGVRVYIAPPALG